MDNRRLNNAQILAAGILNLQPSKSKCPDIAKLESVEEDSWSETSIRRGLEASGICALMYYGGWAIWRTECGYSGQLLQYRATTDEFNNAPLETALLKAIEWATGCSE